MTKFSDVFSTTLKVVGALAIIAVVAGAVRFVVMSAVETSSSAEIVASSEAAAAAREAYLADQDKEAESKPTTMPASKWKRLRAIAIKKHCALEGFTTEEVTLALGKPKSVGVEDDRVLWDFGFLDRSECLKYSGDKCITFREDDYQVHFTKSGRVRDIGRVGPGCSDYELISVLY